MDATWQEIRMLENRLDKAMIKYSEAQSVRRTYEQIVKKLQEERLTFDNQLHQFERALKAKKQEVAELEVMSRDANHARDVAKVGRHLSIGILRYSHAILVAT